MSAIASLTCQFGQEDRVLEDAAAVEQPVPKGPKAAGEPGEVASPSQVDSPGAVTSTCPVWRGHAITIGSYWLVQANLMYNEDEPFGDDDISEETCAVTIKELIPPSEQQPLWSLGFQYDNDPEIEEFGPVSRLVAFAGKDETEFNEDCQCPAFYEFLSKEALRVQNLSGGSAGLLQTFMDKDSSDMPPVEERRRSARGTNTKIQPI